MGRAVSGHTTVAGGGIAGPAPETPPRIGDRPSRAVAAAVQDLWTSFIRGESPGWATYTRPECATALIADGIFAVGVFAVDDPTADERRVWRGRW